MSSRSTREERLTAAFVDLADTLAADFDPADFLYRVAEHCTSLLDIGDAGVMLAAPGGPLRLVAATSERMRLVELFALDASQGPGHTAYQAGHALEHDLTGPGQWPEFSAHAHLNGYLSVYAVPVRLRKETVGVLNLFRRTPESLSDADRKLAHALADATSISLLQQTTLDQHRTLGVQLQQALNTRNAIEQAKGYIAASHGTDPDWAFQRLRAHARRHGLRIDRVARAIVEGTLTLTPPTAGTDGHVDAPADRSRPSHG
ncbi:MULTISPECIES: GAF and ANTAR domain-containing protein [unclassified Streptomyces]